MIRVNLIIYPLDMSGHNDIDITAGKVNPFLCKPYTYQNGINESYDSFYIASYKHYVYNFYKNGGKIISIPY